MIARRTFLKKFAYLAGMPLAASMRSLPVEKSKTVRVPGRIKGFDIDFNWVYDKVVMHSEFAPPGHYADASPEGHIRWYEGMGANVVQTFAVSCNGYAWYKDGFVPAQPGLKYDFLPDMVKLGHKRGMLVMGYFCIGANSKWGKDHPDLSYGAPSEYHIPLTDRYLDYLGRSMADAIQKTGMDGYMIDWVWNPSDRLRENGWLPAERELFSQLTGKPFPVSGHPDDREKLEYERKAIARCWDRIKETRDRTGPRCILWLSCNDYGNPTITGSRMLQEVDWAMNESPDMELYEEGKRMVGPRTRMIQDVVGWTTHNVEKFLADPGHRELDLYGFANPGANSLPAPIEDFLSRPIACFAGNDLWSIDNRNIAELARFYRGLPMAENSTMFHCAWPS
jgi:hypothetical protein